MIITMNDNDYDLHQDHDENDINNNNNFGLVKLFCINS